MNIFDKNNKGSMEITHPGNCQNGNCTTWKIPEWQMHNLENDKKCIPW